LKAVNATNAAKAEINARRAPQVYSGETKEFDTVTVASLVVGKVGVVTYPWSVKDSVYKYVVPSWIFVLP